MILMRKVPVLFQNTKHCIRWRENSPKVLFLCLIDRWKSEDFKCRIYLRTTLVNRQIDVWDSFMSLFFMVYIKFISITETSLSKLKLPTMAICLVRFHHCNTKLRKTYMNYHFLPLLMIIQNISLLPQTGWVYVK